VERKFIVYFLKRNEDGLVWLIVFSATFNKVSVISWRSILLVENHQPVASHWHTFSYNVVSSTHRHERVRTHNISGDCTCSCKSN